MTITLNPDLAAPLAPVLALIIWSLLIWILLFARRIPAMQRAGINPEQEKNPAAYDALLPERAQAAAHNYNHLMEQPTLFYALMFYLALTGEAAGGQGEWVSILGWGYVLFRVLHSFVQVSVGPVMWRFALFVLGSLCLFGLAGLAVF